MSDDLPKANAETMSLTATASDFHMIQGLLSVASEDGNGLVTDLADKERCERLYEAIELVLRPLSFVSKRKT